MKPVTATHSVMHAEAEARFPFGSNWRKFLSCLHEERITEAEQSLRTMLDVHSLAGKSFLDIGCGSGLFSLAAMRLGARSVHSFDYDRNSVGCAQELKRRYFPHTIAWSIEQGSVLDPEYLRRLDQYEVVYSWGVLHHTGNMWAALENVAIPVAPGGTLFIALYNDQGIRSQFWTIVKKAWNHGVASRWIITSFFVAAHAVWRFAKDLARLRSPLQRYREYKNSRGMSYLTDELDWLGGYPFEVAKREDVINFFQRKGFVLKKLTSAGDGRGNNEFVFSRIVSG